MRFRKKPVEIEAVQWTGKNLSEIVRFIEPEDRFLNVEANLVIRTLEGAMIASEGDWIIKGVKGEFYPCKPDVFEISYEPIE